MLILLGFLIGIDAGAQSPYVVEIGAVSFSPDMLVVPAGTTVTWINNDYRNHAMIGDSWPFYTGLLPPGQDFSYQFDLPGYYYYHCSDRPALVGAVEVTSEPYDTYEPLDYGLQSDYTKKSAIQDHLYSSDLTTASEPVFPGFLKSSGKCDVCDQESNAIAELYIDQEETYSFSQDINDAEEAKANTLWIQGSTDAMQYAAVPIGGRLTLMAACFAEGDGYLYEKNPDGRTTRGSYHFQPLNQIGFYADATGRHILAFSANDQLSNSVVIDVIDPNAAASSKIDQEPEYQITEQPRYEPQLHLQPQQNQPDYQQQEYLPEDYRPQDRAMDYQDYDLQPTGHQRSNYQPDSDYDLQELPPKPEDYGQDYYNRQQLIQQPDFRNQPENWQMNGEEYDSQNPQSYDHPQHNLQPSDHEDLGRIQEDYVQSSYSQHQIEPLREDFSDRTSTFWDASAVKLDSSGQLTLEGLIGTDYYLQPSNMDVLTRGLFFDGILYILVANPSSLQRTVTVNPQLGEWNMQDLESLYGELSASKAENLLQISVPAYQSGLIIIQPPRKRYSFSVGPKPGYSFVAGGRPGYSSSTAQRPGYSVNAGPRPGYSFCAGPKPAYSFRIGY